MRALRVGGAIFAACLTLSTSAVFAQFGDRSEEDGPGQRAYLRLRDGSVYSGRVLQWNDRTILWQSPDGKEHEVHVSAIEALMPLPRHAIPVTFRTPQGEIVVLPHGDLSWADEVIAFRPGIPSARVRTDPGSAVGPPDANGVEGRAVPLGNGGEIILHFSDGHLIDIPGPDLVVCEVGGIMEATRVSISDDGEKWMFVGITRGGRSVLDIARVAREGQQFRYVKLVDARAGLTNCTRWPGADIDAVAAIGLVPVPDSEESASDDFPAGDTDEVDGIDEE